MADAGGGAEPTIRLPLDPSLYTIDQEESAFYKSTTGIQDDNELKKHILAVQEKAYDIYGYPCIRRFSFLRLKISRLPAYPEVCELVHQRPGAILLDIGCCFGNDTRKAVVDGWPVANVIASDLRQGFWDAGHELFKTTPDTFPAKFIAGDVFDPSHIAPRDPFYEPPSASPPPLKDLASLNPLQGHISAIHSSAFIHLFDEEQQLQVCKILASLLSPVPGSIIFGCHGGAPQKGLRQSALRGHKMFCHGPDSWKELWDGQIFKKGTVKVEAEAVETPRSDVPGGLFHLLVWSVTRL